MTKDSICKDCVSQKWVKGELIFNPPAYDPPERTKAYFYRWCEKKMTATQSEASDDRILACSEFERVCKPKPKI